MAEETKPKQTKKVVKKKAVQKPPEDLVLKRKIHIAGVSIFNDNKEHFVAGKTYPAGTTVTEEMVEAYNEAAKRLGGTTPIENFCH